MPVVSRANSVRCYGRRGCIRRILPSGARAIEKERNRRLPMINVDANRPLKTMKYRPDFPGNFGCIEDARVFCAGFFDWYNSEHHHSGIAVLTPEIVHYGLADEVSKARLEVLQQAYRLHPERFVRKQPEPPRLPDAVWINPPATASKTPELLTN